MFIILFVSSIVLALVTSFIVVRVFRPPVDSILKKVVGEDVYAAWSKYLVFAIYVVGFSGGVRVWEFEKYLLPKDEGGKTLVMDGERWMVEIYRTVIGTLQSVAWMLLVFFLFAMIAYVILRAMELRKQKA